MSGARAHDPNATGGMERRLPGGIITPEELLLTELRALLVREFETELLRVELFQRTTGAGQAARVRRTA